MPKDDYYIRTYRDIPLIPKMIAEGYTGRKGKGGFYRLTKTEKGRVKESLDLKTGQYHKSVEPQLASIAEARKPAALLAHADRGGQFARKVIAETLYYAASLVPEIADDIVSVDDGMKLGYAWKYGPFELIDQIGVDTFIGLLKDAKLEVPPLVRAAAGRSFYRTEAGQLEYLTTDGDLLAGRAPAGRAAAGRHQAALEAPRQERLGVALGYRRRRRLRRVHQQDERARQ